MNHFVLALLAASAAWPQATEATSSVTFLVQDVRGQGLAGWKVTAFKSNKDDLAPRFTELTGTSIPSGSYRYSLTGPTVNRGSAPPWTPSIGGVLSVSRPQEFVLRTVQDDLLIGGAADRKLPPPAPVEGRIDPIPSAVGANPVRINLHSLIPLVSDVNVLVDAQGKFHIFGGIEGLWMLTVVRGTEVLHSQPVLFAKAGRHASFVLKIGPQPVPTLRVE